MMSATYGILHNNETQKKKNIESLFFNKLIHMNRFAKDNWPVQFDHNFQKSPKHSFTLKQRLGTFGTILLLLDHNLWKVNLFLTFENWIFWA